MKQEFKEYLSALIEERKRLLARVAEIDNELGGYQNLSTVHPHNNTPMQKCDECNGTGTYWDHWAGGIDCPHCGGSGVKKM